ncbi:RNA polymerase II C-terminal domain kinase beta subunit [Knufia peltigerae]|uniref:RNA polymerase II holoenzyme cyclin-like subunit n=1 Tax=Knufia peltigerae TaxID=1002370 RepID=A0AA39CWM5_9EURO|nr:RNA polymerase II C-terminal domain kinase beta subunit [Knufia peltigerae]
MPSESPNFTRLIQPTTHSPSVPPSLENTSTSEAETESTSTGLLTPESQENEASSDSHDSGNNSGASQLITNTTLSVNTNPLDSQYQYCPWVLGCNCTDNCGCAGRTPHDQEHEHDVTMRPANGDHPPARPSQGSGRSGPLSNYVQVAKAYIFEQQIQKALHDTGVSQAREDSIRLAGVLWIDNVRRVLKLPVRTFNTAVIYFHKFRLQHSDGEYSFVDAAAAALFTACKIEDTLKKSRDILCAAHNSKIPRQDHLSPDNPIFEAQSRTIIGLERLMLEASGFDFRSSHPQGLMIKLAKMYEFEKSSPVARTAYSISLDLFRTFAPLKQTNATLAFSCLELAGRLHDIEHRAIWRGEDYNQFKIDRGMVMETLLDLLELYTHHRMSTTVGPEFPVETFLNVRIPLNVECEEKKIPRFTAWFEGGTERNGSTSTSNGAIANGDHPHSRSRDSSKNVSPKDVASPSTNASSASTAPTSVPPPGGANAIPTGTAVRQRMGERGREGTVRFILNPDREREERDIINMYNQP